MLSCAPRTTFCYRRNCFDGIFRWRCHRLFNSFASRTRWLISRVIPAGHRLRVTVASAAFPKYDRNLNTGGDNERDRRYIVVRQRILHDRAHPSFVRLPIIPR
jgi:predicted acyl esterase